MRKLLALTLSAPLFFAASSAFAADDSDHAGGYAAGVGTSVGGAPGLSLRYFVNNKLGLEAVVSKTAATPDGGKESGALDYSVAAEYRLASTNNVAFSGYAGFGQTQATVEGEAAGNTQTIGFGIKGEYFFARSFSIFGGTGVDLVTDSDKDGNALGTETNLFAGPNFLGTMGFSVWFK